MSAVRATSIGPHDIFLLDQWGRQLQEAFGHQPYLVGSVGRGEEHWRDVDIRMMATEAFEGLDDLALRTINMACSLWGRQVTGLPIDFQIQRADEFHEYDDHGRNPMGPRSKTKWATSRSRPVQSDSTSQGEGA